MALLQQTERTDLMTQIIYGATNKQCMAAWKHVEAQTVIVCEVTIQQQPVACQNASCVLHRYLTVCAVLSFCVIVLVLYHNAFGTCSHPWAPSYVSALMYKHLQHVA